jgi:hypothetical protein
MFLQQTSQSSPSPEAAVAAQHQSYRLEPLVLLTLWSCDLQVDTFAEKVAAFEKESGRSR